jgi:hypothetical protein
MEEIDYDKLFTEPEFLEELRMLGIGVTDDFDNYYPIDRIAFNTFNYFNFNDQFNTEESRQTKLYELFNDSKTYVGISNFIFKYVKDKIDTVNITVSIDNSTLHHCEIPIQALFKDYKTSQNIAEIACGNIFRAIVALPFNQECLSRLDSDDPKILQSIYQYFNNKHHTDEFKSAILKMLKKYKPSSYKKLISILES